MNLVIKIFILITLTSCSINQKKEKNPYEQFLAGTLWIQHAGEVRALTYQAYNAARMSLDKILETNKKTNLAIVVDADETIVDNSPFQGHMLNNGKSYEQKDWNHWISLAKAKAVPGSLEFLKYAKSKGVEVFVITNRSISNFKGTYKNLKNLGFPITKKNLIMKKKTSNKESRRMSVTKDYEIVLLIGDNLNDFNEAFEHKTTRQRNKITDQFKNEFGRKFIVLPNPMYGDWENALYDYDRSLSNEKKSMLRKELIKSY